MINDKQVMLSLSWYNIPYRVSGEDGFLPAFLGAGMIPLTLTVLFGISRGGLVIVSISGESLLLTSK